MLMGNWWEKITSRRLRDAVEADEVLTMLRHRAAYRTVWFVVAVLGAATIVCLKLTTDPMWQTVGFTLFAVFFLLILVYESILAYDGVMKGEDELIAQLKIPRSTIILKALMYGVLTAVYLTVIQQLGEGGFDPLFDIVSGVLIALVFAWLYYSRWRKAMKDN
jgi:uncharacterized membrane protein